MIKKSNINIKKAVLFALLASISTSLTALFVKLAAPNTSIQTTVFFRFSISLVYLVIILMVKKYRGERIPYRTKHVWWHIFRALMAVTATMLFYYSLRYISLVDAVVLMRTNPFFVVILSLIFLGASSSKKHILAICFGFVGILLILEPGRELFQPASLMALLGGLVAAMSFMMLRANSKRDHPYTSMLYYFPLAFIITGLMSGFQWKTPDFKTLMFLVGVGVFGTLYQEFLIRASQYASAKIISSLMYVSIIFSGLFGILIWGDIPNLMDLVGIIFVCCGGLLTVLFNGV